MKGYTAEMFAEDCEYNYRRLAQNEIDLDEFMESISCNLRDVENGADNVLDKLKSDLLVAQQALATEKMIAEMRRKERIELRAARDGLAQAAREAEEDYRYILGCYRNSCGERAELREELDILQKAWRQTRGW